MALTRSLKNAIRNALLARGYVLIREDQLKALAADAEHAGRMTPVTSAPTTAAPRVSDTLLTSAPAIARSSAGADGNVDAQLAWRLGKAAHDTGDLDNAYRHYARALMLIHKYGPARAGMGTLANHYYAEARKMLAARDTTAAKRALVRAAEGDPANAEIRNRLEKLIAAENKQDITRHCYVFHDPKRAETVHREAVLRCLEYVSIAGVTGDILEFGTLAGWSARIFCETMRDLMNMGQVHLFDSFEGLPEYTSVVDINSYEIAGRNIWSDKMKFTSDFVQQLGSSIDAHIHDRLSDIIPAERIIMHRGFFSETLKQPLNTKAAIVHIDCDLYQSTVEVLQRLYEMDVFQDGCVLMFDDWNCNKASPNYGERRAFEEFLNWQDRYTTSPFFSYGFNGAAFFLHDRNA